MEQDPQQVLSSQIRGHFHVHDPPPAATLNEGVRLALGQLWNEHRQTLPAAAALVATIVLIGLGIRYRPRGDKRQ